jgi:hypothetical protein
MTRAEAIAVRVAYERALSEFANAGAVLAGRAQDGTSPTTAEAQRAADAHVFLEAARSKYLESWER